MENYVTTKYIIKELLQTVPEQINKLYIAQDVKENVKEIISIAKQHKVSYYFVPKQKIISLYNKNYSGFLAVLSAVRYYTVEEILNITKNKKFTIILILDEITDPQNFAAILRNAVAFEVSAVVIQQWNQAQVNQTVVESSRGAAKIVPIVKEKNIYTAIKKLKKENFNIYATMPMSTNFNKTIELSKLNFEKIAIVLGNEHKGIRKNILNECDGFITIPHSIKIQSLNVSVACGIVLYELYKICFS